MQPGYTTIKRRKEKARRSKTHFFGLTGLCDRTDVLPHDELRHVFADGKVLLVRALGAVFSHPFGKRLVLLVKGSEQCFILRCRSLGRHCAPFQR